MPDFTNPVKSFASDFKKIAICWGKVFCCPFCL